MFLLALAAMANPTDRDGMAERVIATVLLLADDVAISDPSIQSQLGEGIACQRQARVGS